ncbi:MAG: carboxy terminal-processing peptidase [Chitinophagales bacterium]
MKSIQQYLLLFLAFLLLPSFEISSDGDEQAKKDVLMELVMKNVKRKHYQAASIDDDFSKKVFAKYLERLDKNKRLFLEQDVKTLKRFEEQLDEEIEQNERAFFELSVMVLQKRLEAVEGMINKTLEKPFDFEKEEFLEASSDKRAFAKTEKEWRENWRKYLKYATLKQLTKLLTDQEEAIEAGNVTVEAKSLAVLEEEARAKVLKNQKSWYKRITERTSLQWFHVYLQSITNVFDPHTVFMPPKSRQSFETSLRGSLEGIGATLREKNGKITIVNLVPTGPAAKQGQLQPEDAILKVAEKDGEKVDIVGMEMTDAIKLIKGPKGTEVVLTVQKPNGKTIDIPIIRDTVILDKGSVKLAVLQQDESDEPVAYLKLEKFYVDFKNKNGRSCARDVKAALKKINDQNLQKLIVDLRSNGGGSLQQVVDMVGLFIEKGPIVQVKNTNGSIGLHTDKDPAIHYTGDLVVLVNGGSASASEIFAAAIQDYQRGLIIGSRATFGKGSAQVLYPLEPYLSNEQLDLKPLGSIKTTIQKFYRVNGGTTQTQGLTPDIVLPDAYSYIEKYGERRRDHVLAVDEVNPAKFIGWNHSVQNLEQLHAESEKRLANSELYATMDAYHQFSQERKKNTYKPLSLTTFRAEQTAAKLQSKNYTDRPEVENFEVAAMEIEKADIAADSLLQKKTNKFHKQLRKDFYLYETLQIINNLQTDSGAMNEEE